MIDSKENRFNVLAQFPKIIFYDYGCAFVSGNSNINKNRTRYGQLLETVEANYLGRMALSYEYDLYISQYRGEGRQASKYRMTSGSTQAIFYRTYYYTTSYSDVF